MKIIKVNNIFSFFLLRYFFILIFCYLTMFVTGRIADMDVLLGWRSYTVGGVSTQVALRVFSSIGTWGNRYFLISLIGLFLTLIIYFLIRKSIDKSNFNIWKITMLAPGILIYSNAPTKETLFFYPAIFFIILECKYITGKKSFNLSNFFFKFLILIFMVILRGDLAMPYVLLSIISIIIKNFQVGKTYKKLNIKRTMINAYLLSILANILIALIFPAELERITNYLGDALEIQANTFRPDQFINPFNDLTKTFQAQYLSLFPTLGELLQKPYQFIIIFDSIMIIYCFMKSWAKLFETVDPYKKLKKMILILFTYIAIIYFSLYGILGSINLGSSQRFRINYIPLGIIFPLILDKKLRDKKATFSLNN